MSETGLVLVLGPVALAAVVGAVVKIQQLRARSHRDAIEDVRLRQRDDKDCPNGHT